MNAHFISGLPRSGSTLLASIIKQNPRFFHAGMSSSLYGLFYNAMGVMAGEGFSLISEVQRENILRGLFVSWITHLPQNPVLFDTHRLWTSCLPALLRVFPDAKIVCMVRDVGAVIDSFERILRKNPLVPSLLFSELERNNVYTRSEALLRSDRLIGSAWASLKEAYYGPYAKSLLLIEYDYLAKMPHKAISSLYEFIDEPLFQHNFESVGYEENSFDSEMRMPGLHHVFDKVRFDPIKSSLPPDLGDRFSAQNFWTDGSASLATVAR